MEEELKLDQAVPTLTFEPFTETKKEAPAPQQEMPKPEPIYEEEALLSEQEKKQQLIQEIQVYWKKQEKPRIKKAAEAFGISSLTAKKYILLSWTEQAPTVG